MKANMHLRLSSFFAVLVAFLSLSTFLPIAWALPTLSSGLDHTNLSRDKNGEAAFNNAKNKGTDMVFRLSGSTEQSTWTNYAKLQEQGWTVEKEFEPKSDDILQEGGAYAALCLDEESDTLLTASHKESGGFYSSIYNTPRGVIIADNLLSPAEALKKGNKQGEAPGLASWADVVFLQYEELARKNGDNIQDLQYIFQAVISNDETISIVEYIAKKTDQSVRNWDNKLTFPLNSDEGKALIGTPNGKGAGWLAATHKKQLGNKTIKDISVFTEDDTVGEGPEKSIKERTLFMMFRLG